MIQIPLTQGKFTMVDDEDYNYLSQWDWYYNQGYAMRHKQGETFLMHRIILNSPKGKYTDHIDHNKLNNQKSNLRICTDSQNLMNSLPRRGISKYKGVDWSKRRKLWRSRIVVSGKSIHLGRFSSEIDAAKAYDRAARLYFGEYAYTNFSKE